MDWKERSSHNHCKGRLLEIIKNSCIHLVLLFIFLCPAGCSIKIPVAIGQFDNQPVIERVPLSIGVHYPAHFRDYSHTETKIIKMHFSLGQPSMALFKQIFTLMFNEVVELGDNSGHDGRGRVLSGVIEPEITSFWCSQIDDGNFAASISYQFVLYTPEGAEIARLVAQGSGYRRYTFGWVEPQMAAVSEDAIRDAAADFMVNFGSHNGVREWLRGQGVSPIDSE
jgi:hypothetical protein